jgi:AcrR family transcriptional regulator
MGAQSLIAQPTAKPGRRSTAAGGRSLSGEKAQRIINAMRESIAEVGVAGSTFDRVSRKAEVSRGLLHYYFGTKERLLVEVIRRDTEVRIEVLGSALEQAESLDEVIGAFLASFERTLTEEKGYVYMVSELFVAGRSKPELEAELGKLYSRARKAFAEILREKERQGVISPRFDIEAILSYLFATGDGAIIQQLTDPTLDPNLGAEASYEVTKFLLGGE